MNPRSQKKTARMLLLATCILIAGVYLVTAASVTDTPTRWPPLADLLKKWDAESWDAVQKAAEGGELTAQHYLGYCYTEGRRVAQDTTLAMSWYERAGKAGYMPSFSNIGVAYGSGKGVPQDFAKAMEYYRLAADAGMAQAQANIGFLYRDGKGVPRDRVEALKWFRLAADQGHAVAMVEIGRLFRFGQGVTRDSDEASRWFRKAAEKNDPLGKFNLGMVYEDEGRGEDAIKFYRQAAEQGLADAMFRIYLCYRNGVGVAVDRNEARKWLEKGAEAGSAWVQTELGYFFENPPNNDDSNKLRVSYMFQAVKWYQRAADQNLPAAQNYLASCYLEGKGVEQDEERGLELLRNAADQGHPRSLRDLARLYAAGIGAPRNSQDKPMLLWQRMTKIEPEGDNSDSWAEIAYKEVIFRFLRGLGTDRDLIAAAHWYCRAARAGMEGYELEDQRNGNPSLLKRPFERYSGPSESDRGLVLLTWPNVEKYSAEFATVLSLYRQAASMKKPDALKEIADMYATGRNAPVDSKKAWLWYTLAAQAGSADARAKVSEFESRMTHDELAEARKLFPDLVQELKQVAAALRETTVRP